MPKYPGSGIPGTGRQYVLCFATFVTISGKGNSLLIAPNVDPDVCSS